MNFIEECFKKLEEKYSWGATLGYNTIIHLQFGEPSLRVGRTNLRGIQISPDDAEQRLVKNREVYAKGEWRLSIFNDEWSIKFNDDVEINTDLSLELIGRSLLSLSGQKLTSVCCKNNGVSTFNFDLGAVLTTKVVVDAISAPIDSWILYEPGGQVLVFRSDGKYAYHPDTEDPDDCEWLDIID